MKNGRYLLTDSASNGRLKQQPDYLTGLLGGNALPLQPRRRRPDHVPMTGTRLAPADQRCIRGNGLQRRQHRYITSLDLLPQPAPVLAHFVGVG
jgi:hypothetical protein